MKRPRRTVLILIAILAGLALFVQRLPGNGGVRSGTETEPIAQAQIADEGRTVILRGGDAVLSEVTIGQWRQWAVLPEGPLADGPVRLGDVELGADAFSRFTVAVAGPDGRHALIAANAYAMATDVSATTLLDGRGGFDPFGDPVRATIESVAWSSSVGQVALLLGTARSSGERVLVRDVPSGSDVLSIDGEALATAWTEADRDLRPTQDAGPFLPGMHDVAWSEDGTELRFTSDRPDGDTGEVHWSGVPSDATILLVDVANE
jgi:hypothetical protein